MVANLPAPWSFPEWHAFARETDLAAQLVCAAANGIGHADYANVGNYYVALFGFANGIERLAKITIAADLLRTTKALPREAQLRSFGHELHILIPTLRKIESRRGMELTYQYPDDPITTNILDCLDLFADARRGRYANIAVLTGSKASFDPVAIWWTRVVDPILERHYRGTSRQSHDTEDIAVVEAMLGGASMVLHHDELGRLMNDITTAARRTAECEVAQKYGRFYTLRIIRWMSDLCGDLVSDGAYRDRIPTLFGHEERVQTFRTTDHFLLTRRRWPLL